MYGCGSGTFLNGSFVQANHTKTVPRKWREIEHLDDEVSDLGATLHATHPLTHPLGNPWMMATSSTRNLCCLVGPRGIVVRTYDLLADEEESDSDE